MRTVTFFSSPTCHKCKDSLKYWNEISENNSDYIFAYEDTSENLDLAKKFNVMMLPTFLITEGGVEIARVSGYVSKKILQDFLNKWLTRNRE